MIRLAPFRLMLASFALLLPSIAAATQPLMLTNRVFVERTLVNANGRSSVILSSADKIAPGDQLVFVLRYLNTSDKPSDRLTITNEMPGTVAFQYAGKGADVSIDGGKSWGTLSRLTVAERSGRRRSARPEDVTHIRWQFAQPVPAGGNGSLTFRGIVR